MANKEKLYKKSVGTKEVYELPEECSIQKSSQASNISKTLRPGLNRFDTDFHRPEDRIPTNHHDIIRTCQGIYKKNGLIRNIIDLMTDFAASGLDLRHPNKKQELFYKKWAKRVELEARAHDWIKLFLRDANVIVRRKTAIITKPVIKEMTQAYDFIPDYLVEDKFQEIPEKIKVQKNDTKKGEIPWRYTFISPVLVDKIGGAVGKFIGGQKLGIRLSQDLLSSIINPKTDAEKELRNKLPKEIIEAARKGNKLIALDERKIYVDYYKKDDWEDWGTPFLYGIIEDVLLKDKMKQADMAALDGVINTIRLWKLGNSEQKILPTQAAINKLKDILSNNVGGGALDIIWNDLIDFKFEYPPTDKILGPQKYQSVDKDIISGLGIPSSLVGGNETSTRNAQSAFVQLKTLVERLEYVRSRCINWINSELLLVAKAMGFKTIPSINFATMSLRDEAAEKQLIVQLLDRGIISIETVHKVFGQDFIVELENLKIEEEIRTSNKPVFEKANPFYRPISVMEEQLKGQLELEKLKTQGGGENNAGDLPRKTSVDGPGRPPNTKDTSPRKQRTNKSLSVYAAIGDNILKSIDTIVDEMFLSKNKTKNIRSLTQKQKGELNNIKLLIFSNMTVDKIIDKENIKNILNNIDKTRFNEFNKNLGLLIKKYKERVNRSISCSEVRMLTISCWCDLLEN